jgi:hypothetical protein
MNPDNRIIPIEASHPRAVIVTRHIFDGTNCFGKPNSHRLSEDLFYSFEDAFRFASEDQTVNHHFETYLRFPIHANLIDSESGSNELLTVEIGGIRGISPRSVKGHHGVSTDHETFFHIIVEEVGSHDVFDRGLAWVDTTYPIPHFKFTVLGHEMGWQSNLQQELEGILKRTNEVLHDLVTGMDAGEMTSQYLLKQFDLP